MDVGEGGRASVSLFLSEERDIVLFGDFLFPAGSGSDWFQLTFGPRVYAALLEDENSDVLSVSLGGGGAFQALVGRQVRGISAGVLRARHPDLRHGRQPDRPQRPR